MRIAQKWHVGDVQDGEEVANCIDLSLVEMVLSEPGPLYLIDNLLDAAVGKIDIYKFLKGSHRINQFQLQCIFRMHYLVFDID